MDKVDRSSEFSKANLFGGRKELQKQPMKSMQTEATENGDRDSTLNKSTNSLLTSEYL